jgi:hypothetical protein
MLENDQSFIYEKDEDLVNLKMDKFNTEEPNNKYSIGSHLNTSDIFKENISFSSNLNKELKTEHLKNKDSYNNTYSNHNFNNDNCISERQISRSIKKKNYIEEEGPKIISLDQVPLFRKIFISVHPFILNGYRIHHNFKDCFFSMFKLHNETLNIWTHFIPFWGFIILAINLIISKLNLNL